MHRFVSLIVIASLTLLSAGCLNESSHPAAEDEGICLLTPGEGFAIFEGQAHYTTLIGGENPHILPNYSLDHVAIPPGNATPPHRLLGSSECVCLTGGDAEIRCDNTTLTVHEGEVVILPDGVLQSIAAVGDDELQYVNVIQPPYSPEIEVAGAVLETLPPGTDGVGTDSIPIVIPDPRDGIEWDIGSDMMIYTLANPVLMPEKNLPINYSVAYAELLPGGSADSNRLAGASELIYVITGEIEVFTPEGHVVRAPAGSAVWVAPDQEKGYRNAGAVNATMLSFVDPAWTPERTVTVG